MHFACMIGRAQESRINPTNSRKVVGGRAVGGWGEEKGGIRNLTNGGEDEEEEEEGVGEGVRVTPPSPRDPAASQLPGAAAA